MAYVTTTTATGKRRRKVLSTRGTMSLNCTKKPAGGKNEGVETAGDLAFSFETKKLAGKARRLARSANAANYLNNTWEYQLYRGDAPFGGKKTMTGREACDLNKAYEKKFFDDNRPEARLYRWYRVGAFVVPNGTTADEKARLIFERSCQE